MPEAVVSVPDAPGHFIALVSPVHGVTAWRRSEVLAAGSLGGLEQGDGVLPSGLTRGLLDLGGDQDLRHYLLEVPWLKRVAGRWGYARSRSSKSGIGMFVLHLDTALNPRVL